MGPIDPGTGTTTPPPLGDPTVTRFADPSVRPHRRGTDGRRGVGLATVHGERRLVRAAGGGDQVAWDAIVDAHVDALWRICREHALRDDECAAVCELVWLNLLDGLPQLGGQTLRERLIELTTLEARRACLRMHRTETGAHLSERRQQRRISQATPRPATMPSEGAGRRG